MILIDGKASGGIKSLVPEVTVAPKSAFFALKDHVSSTLLRVRSKWYMPREWMYLCNTQTDSYSTELHRYTTHKTQRLGQLTKPQFNKSLPCT